VHHGLLRADEGQVLLDGREVTIGHPRAMRGDLGIGMVYQHFTWCRMTGAENLVLSRADAPAVIDWASERRR
jgi:ABC-type uncharacterized transport system ATPase subunit